MKILILTPRFPFPENGGDVLRINGVARYLKSQGHSLCLVSYVEPHQIIDKDAKSIYDKVYTVERNPLTSAINSLLFFVAGRPIQCGYYYSSKFLHKLKDVLNIEKPDVQICHLLRTTYYCEKLGITNTTIVEMTDALSKTYAISQDSKGVTLKKIIYKFERSRIKKYEQAVIRKFPKVVLVSRQDVDYLEEEIHDNQISLAVHSNGVETLPKLPQSYNRYKICFVGNMRTLQNQDAVLRFVKDIFPLILKQVPQAKFFVVGAQPPKRIHDLASDSIIVTGYVDDIYEAISDSCVAVAPVQIAAGIQNKVLVAMGAGVPVVMSSLISKAIPELKDSQNCFICDDNEKFAEKCIELMTKPYLRSSMSKNGWTMVKDNYSWQEKLNGYEVIPE